MHEPVNWKLDISYKKEIIQNVYIYVNKTIFQTKYLFKNIKALYKILEKNY